MKLTERGVDVDHSTIHTWVLRYRQELETELQKRKRPVAESWHWDVIAIKIKNVLKWLYKMNKAYHKFTTELLYSAAYRPIHAQLSVQCCVTGIKVSKAVGWKISGQVKLRIARENFKIQAALGTIAPRQAIRKIV